VRLDGRCQTPSLGELYLPIATDLAETRRILADELTTGQEVVGRLCRHVGQFHGKLLRPGLLLLSAKACGAVRDEHHILAAVVELVHLATLVHDDLLDEADIRRRAPTVNRQWGSQQAVLMGDFLYSHAFALCSQLDSQFAAQLIGRTAITVCEGEIMQVANRGNYELSEAEYLDIIGRKTATLLETCCHLGAAYAGADQKRLDSLKQFGRSLGIAFQITDDLLDLVGDESEVGKSLGRDLGQGEPTLPVIHCLRHSPQSRRQRLLRLLAGDYPRRSRQITALLLASGSITYAQTAAREHSYRARQALDELPPSAARESLEALAEFVCSRVG